MFAFLLSSLSAVLSVCAFIFPAYCWWMTVPGFCLVWAGVVQRVRLRFFFLWGLVFYGVIASVFIAPVFLSVSCHRLLFVCGWALLIIYMSSAVALWAFCFQFFVKNISSCVGVVGSFFCGVFALFCLIWFFDQLFLWPFDVIEGCRCFHPLVPWMSVKIGRLFVVSVGHMSATFFFCFLSVLGVYCWRFVVSIVLLFVLFALVVSCCDKIQSCPAWLSNVCVASVAHAGLSESIDACDQCLVDITRCLHAVQMKKNYSVVIMPESVVPYDLFSARVYRAVCQACLHTPFVCFGAYKMTQEGHCANACFVGNHGFVNHVYTKQHRVMFVERVPRLFALPAFRAWFLGVHDDFDCDWQERPTFLVGSQSCVPVLCSELFFGSFDGVYAASSSLCALCLVNDSWFGFLGKKILSCAGLYSCLSRGLACVYASYDYAFFCSCDADIYVLNTFRF